MAIASWRFGALLAFLPYIIANDLTNIPLAATLVSTSSSSGIPYFKSETIQLTDEVISNLKMTSNSTFISLFDFANNTIPIIPVSGSCKPLPGDPYFPDGQAWDMIEQLTAHHLIRSTPLAAPCYEDWPENYSVSECDLITNNWTYSPLHIQDPTSVGSPLYEGRTCLPPDLVDQSSPSNCTVGGYPTYVISAIDTYVIQLAVNFARNTGMRLVIKNTGHDFNGRSVGAGALSVWTHSLKDLAFIANYSGPGIASGQHYSGPAIKFGSGIQAFELYNFADLHGVTAVGGEAVTVGVGGGYLFGGGHSPLGSLFGMAADQVLSMEVVTADGSFMTADVNTNSDLFWALRGGGGSTFGVVTSITSKVYPKIGATVVTFNFSSTGNVSEEAFWLGFDAYLDYFIPNTEAGTYSYFDVSKVAESNYLFRMAPFFAPNLSIAETTTLLEPWFTRLASSGINISPVVSYHDNFLDAWTAGFPEETVGRVNGKTASRLWPRQNWENSTLLNQTKIAVSDAIKAGYSLIAFNIAPSLAAGSYPDNAVNPAWRNTVFHAILVVVWDINSTVSEIQEANLELTYGTMQKWRDLSPGAGAYMSEGDVIEPNFQQAFYGSFYDRLKGIKDVVDPYGLFYTATGVGSEEWIVQTFDGLWNQNGRLCKV